MPPAPDAQFTFRTYTISHLNDDLVLTGILQPFPTRSPDSKQQMEVQSFSLHTKSALHPPVRLSLFYGEGESGPFSTRAVFRLHPVTEPAAVLVHFFGAGLSSSGITYPEMAELWSADGRGRLDARPPMEMRDRYVRLNRIPQSGLHIKVRFFAKSSKRSLVVRDSRAGDVVQEIGPFPGQVGDDTRVLVSPDGTRVAAFGRREIRFYRVNLDEAYAAAARRR